MSMNQGGIRGKSETVEELSSTWMTRKVVQGRQLERMMTDKDREKNWDELDFR